MQNSKYQNLLLKPIVVQIVSPSIMTHSKPLRMCNDFSNAGIYKLMTMPQQLSMCNQKVACQLLVPSSPSNDDSIWHDQTSWIPYLGFKSMGMKRTKLGKHWKNTNKIRKAENKKKTWSWNEQISKIKWNQTNCTNEV